MFFLLIRHTSVLSLRSILMSSNCPPTEKPNCVSKNFFIIESQWMYLRPKQMYYSIPDSKMNHDSCKNKKCIKMTFLGQIIVLTLSIGRLIISSHVRSPSVPAVNKIQKFASISITSATVSASYISVVHLHSSQYAATTHETFDQDKALIRIVDLVFQVSRVSRIYSKAVPVWWPSMNLAETT